LISLDMQGNRITWDDLAQARLERSPNLLHLDLSDNPLLRAPDIGNLRGLQLVSLDNASLTQLPQGLDSLPTPTEASDGIGLSVLDLSDNQFTALPQGWCSRSTSPGPWSWKAIG
jgi:Leucine-rich repeat (LRR) protein